MDVLPGKLGSGLGSLTSGQGSFGYRVRGALASGVYFRRLWSGGTDQITFGEGDRGIGDKKDRKARTRIAQTLVNGSYEVNWRDRPDQVDSCSSGQEN